MTVGGNLLKFQLLSKLQCTSRACATAKWLDVAGNAPFGATRSKPSSPVVWVLLGAHTHVENVGKGLKICHFHVGH